MVKICIWLLAALSIVETAGEGGLLVRSFVAPDDSSSAVKLLSLFRGEGRHAFISSARPSFRCTKCRTYDVASLDSSHHEYLVPQIQRRNVHYRLTFLARFTNLSNDPVCKSVNRIGQHSVGHVHVAILEL